MPEDNKETPDTDTPKAEKPADITGWKAWFYKDRQFSKTASFVTIGNFLVLLTWFFQSWFVGVEFTTSFFHGVVPAFNTEAALAILGALNGTYLGNNFIKKQTPAE